MADGVAEIPVDYQWINWEHLYTYVGRAVMGDHVPLMSDKIVNYLEHQAREMHRCADRLSTAAQAIRASRKKEDK